MSFLIKWQIFGENIIDRTNKNKIMDDNHELFTLSIDSDIQDIAAEILTGEEIKKAENIAENLHRRKHRQNTIKTVQDLFGTFPKRPLFYLNLDLRFLPDENYTRDIIRYSGDYIDLLLKSLAYRELKFKPFLGRLSFGVTIKRMERKLELKLYDILVRYNKFIYVPAKHDFEVKDKAHRFSSDETVFILFITKKLAEGIESLIKNHL